MNDAGDDEEKPGIVGNVVGAVVPAVLRQIEEAVARLDLERMVMRDESLKGQNTAAVRIASERLERRIASIAGTASRPPIAA